MNWEAFATIAEVISAIAVVVTLIYLTVQLKQNTRALKSATIDSLNTAMVSNIEFFVANNDVLELMIKTDSGEPLTELEKSRYYYLLLMLVRRFEGFYFQRTLGFVDPQMIAGFEHSLLSIIGRNKDWWNQAKLVLSPDFISYVENEIAKKIPDAVHPGFRTDRNS